VSVTVNRCRFVSNRLEGLLATAAHDASLTLLMTGSATDSQLKSQFLRGPSPGQGQDGVAVVNADNADVVVTIENAFISGFDQAGVRVAQSPGNASALSSLRATIRGNRIDSTAMSNSAAIVGRFSSTVGQTSEARLLIADNETPTGSGLNQFGLLPGITITTPDAGTNPGVDVTISGNHLDMRESSSGSNIRGPIGMSILGSQGDVCANILDNISHWYPTGFNPMGGGIRLEQSGAAVSRLEQGSQSLAAPAGTVLSANNPAPLGTLMTTEAVGTIAVVPNGSCRLPDAP
jgi:hypothetical protein